MLDIYDAICISKIIHTHSIDHKIVTGTFFRTFCWVRLVKILKWSGIRTGNGSGSGSISGLESGQPVQGPKKGLTDAAIMLCKLNKSL